MRSISFSACFISPIDSSRCFFARSWKPQSAHIFDWQKYWLIAVSSMVSAPLKSGDDFWIAPS